MVQSKNADQVIFRLLKKKLFVFFRVFSCFSGYTLAKMKRNKHDRKLIRTFQLKSCHQFFEKACQLLKNTEEDRKIHAKSLRYFTFLLKRREKLINHSFLKIIKDIERIISSSEAF